jgi:hypothetical protein
MFKTFYNTKKCSNFKDLEGAFFSTQEFLLNIIY